MNFSNTREPQLSYNSMMDPHLASYFNNPRIRKHLRRTGLILPNGEAVTEETYRLYVGKLRRQEQMGRLVMEAVAREYHHLNRSRQAAITQKMDELRRMEVVHRIREDEWKTGVGSLGQLLPRRPPSRPPLFVFTPTPKGQSRVGRRRMTVAPRNEEATRRSTSEPRGRRERRYTKNEDKDKNEDNDEDKDEDKDVDEKASSRRSSETRSRSSSSRRDRRRTSSSSSSSSSTSSSSSSSRSSSTSSKSCGHGSDAESCSESSISRSQSSRSSSADHDRKKSVIRIPNETNTAKDGSTASQHSFQDDFESVTGSSRSESPSSRSSLVPHPPPPRPTSRSVPRRCHSASNGATKESKNHRRMVRNRANGPRHGLKPVGQPHLKHNGCLVTLHFFGVALSLHNELSDGSSDILVEQQHCGGNTVTVFRERVTPGSDIVFYSYRRHGYPFSVTIYLGGRQDSRLSTCCEYRHVAGVRLGGIKGHFGMVGVKGGEPCFRCQFASRSQTNGKDGGHGKDEIGGKERKEDSEDQMGKGKLDGEKEDVEEKKKKQRGEKEKGKMKEDEEKVEKSGRRRKKEKQEKNEKKDRRRNEEEDDVDGKTRKQDEKKEKKLEQERTNERRRNETKGRREWSDSDESDRKDEEERVRNDRRSDHGCHKGIDHRSDQVSDHGNDHRSDHGHNQDNDRSSDHRNNHRNGQRSDHRSDHKNDHKNDLSIYHRNDHRSDHKNDHRSDHGNDHGNDHRSDHKNDHSSDHRGDHRSDHRKDHGNDHGSYHDDDHRSGRGDKVSKKKRHRKSQQGPDHGDKTPTDETERVDELVLQMAAAVLPAQKRKVTERDSELVEEMVVAALPGVKRGGKQRQSELVEEMVVTALPGAKRGGKQRESELVEEMVVTALPGVKRGGSKGDSELVEKMVATALPEVKGSGGGKVAERREEIVYPKMFSSSSSSSSFISDDGDDDDDDDVDVKNGNVISSKEQTIKKQDEGLILSTEAQIHSSPPDKDGVGFSNRRLGSAHRHSNRSQLTRQRPIGSSDDEDEARGQAAGVKVIGTKRGQNEKGGGSNGKGSANPQLSLPRMFPERVVDDQKGLSLPRMFPDRPIATDEKNEGLVSVDGSHDDQTDSLKDEENIVVVSRRGRGSHGNDGGHGDDGSHGNDGGHGNNGYHGSDGGHGNNDRHGNNGSHGGIEDGRIEKGHVPALLLSSMKEKVEKSLGERGEKKSRSEREGLKESARSDSESDEGGKTARSDNASDRTSSSRSDSERVSHTKGETPSGSQRVEKASMHSVGSESGSAVDWRSSAHSCKAAQNDDESDF